ncbi:short-chain dehydrogenase, putative [Talaromyces stipitatus ATCC 10500]|uniref:Short-chain dehydrogenase, putative n=1 Tax=Talaromyces stipitatus (strain ATCC 10500 / CBS 375.48 / QM 6759 / NRRL 1006) TaxID=441959 RepID=B8MC69_TALSN|nr:short-chain dehydrogenase, putative [Talaromyces stipitatus ATCC 10500]EED18515.1 short-chain dehydrogenase, putative [Talaromyces stipitatus ATCC 10500]
MDPEILMQVFRGLSATNVTKNVHKEPYPAISPSRPELSQTGKVVLVTGGGTGVGFSIAKAFIRASVDTIIIIGRRADVLEKAASDLKQEARLVRTSSKIITRSVDVVDLVQVDAFWEYLATQGINVDVLVANVGRSSVPKSMTELGATRVWEDFEINVKSPIYFTEKFYNQPGDKKKYLINVSSSVIHMTAYPGVGDRPAYPLTKMAGTMFFQLTAQNVSPEKMQVISFHPGYIYSTGWETVGLKIPRELFDSDDLCGAFAVWTATDEAKFLHGRFVWASWDVEELASGELRKRIDEDPYFLRTSISGLNGTNLA